jgi:MoaA/NifB/PqqE/SkfB family radical SAM enzyme
MQVYHWQKSLKVTRLMAQAYLRHRLTGCPHWGHLYVTRRCNLSCDYCFFRDPRKPDLPNADLERILDRMWELGIAFLAFHGGEPTLRKDFPELVRYAHDKGFFLYLNTNGTRLTPAYLDRLGEAGIDLINMSVDSILEFKHSCKDISHHKQVLADLLRARERHGFEVTVNFVLTRVNLDVALETLTLMHRYRVPISVGLIVKHLFHDEQEPSLFFRTPAQRARLCAVLDQIITLREAGYNIIEPTAYFRDLKRFVRGELQWECLAGKDSIGVDTQGEIKLCGTLPTEAFTIHDLDGEGLRQLYAYRRETYGDCHHRCVTNCRYVTAYYHRHPLRFVAEMVGLRWRQRRAGAPPLAPSQSEPPSREAASEGAQPAAKAQPASRA